MASFASSYIKTEASQVTRSADSASITGSNFSSWYRADEGTIYSEYQGGVGNASRRVYVINDGSFNNLIQGVVSNAAGTAANFFDVTTNGVTQAQLGISSSYSATIQTQACSYKFNDVNFSKNGGAASADTSAIIPIVNNIVLGASIFSSSFLNGTIKRLTFYPKALTATQLQAITG